MIYDLNTLRQTLRRARFKKDDPPAPPDPYATANAQSAMNKETAVYQDRLNAKDQITPYGKLEYYQAGLFPGTSTPYFGVRQTLAEPQQKMKDLTDQAGIQYGNVANRQLQNVSGRLSNPLDFGNLGPTPVANEQTRQNVANSLYARMQPQMDRDRARLETRLATQGIGIGSEAYRNAMDDLNRGQNDMRLAVENQALGQMGQLYGLEKNAYDTASNQMVMERNQPLNELAAMLTGSQVQGPSFVNTPQTSVAPTDLTGAVYNSYAGNLQNYQQQQANNNAMMGGLFGLGSAGIGAYGMSKLGPAALALSDRRLKRNIHRIGTLPNGLAVYRYRYVWGGPEQVGVMADEVKRVLPHAVVNIGGYDAVNYAEVLNA